jgi:hypothetical protein
MTQYVIEVNDPEVDDRADQIIGRMIDEGKLQLVTPHRNLNVTVVARVMPTDKAYQEIGLRVVKTMEV